MTDFRINIPDHASRLFDNYLICLAKASIPERQRRWYAMRVEEFIKAQNGRKIKTLTAQEITRYPETTGRQNQLSGSALT